MKTIVNDIPSRESFLHGETLDIGYPWVTYGAIIALEYIVNKDFNVLEFGSGGSTVFWAGNCKSVKSFETDPGWYEKTKKRLAGYTNVEIILTDEAGILEAISKMPDSYYDLVLNDSNPHLVNRLSVANAAIPKIKPKGWFVVDNYEKYHMNHFDYVLWNVYTFDEIIYGGRGTRLCQKK